MIFRTQKPYLSLRFNNCIYVGAIHFDKKKSEENKSGFGGICILSNNEAYEWM